MEQSTAPQQGGPTAIREAIEALLALLPEGAHPVGDALRNAASAITVAAPAAAQDQPAAVPANASQQSADMEVSEEAPGDQQ
eukprot:13389569-Alexandrium_andersonii.AAC.1